MKSPIQNWNIDPLNKICTEIIDCINKTAPSVDFETPFKMIRTTNVKRGRVNLDEVRYVDESTFIKWTRRSRLKKNDVILTREAPLGEVGLLRVDDTVFLGQRTMVYRSNNKKLSQRFMYYSFLSYPLQSQIQSLGSGSTVEHLRVPHAETLKIPYPPLPIQRKIAAILSAYDDLIENNNRRISILERMAEEIYREWFVRLRFPGHEKVKIVKGVPEGWGVKKIGEVVEHQIGGGWGEESPIGAENIPVYIIRGTDFKNIEKGNFTTVPLRYEKSSSILTRSLQHGDIVLENSVNAQSRCTGNTIIITQKILDQFNHPVIPASFCKLLRFKNPELSFYIWKQLRCLYEQGIMEYFQNVATNGIANFQVGRFLSRFEVKIPNDKSLYKEFWTFDSSNQKVILTNLKSSRDQLLSRLMSGKIDVEKLDIKFPASMLDSSGVEEKEEAMAHV